MIENANNKTYFSVVYEGICNTPAYLYAQGEKAAGVFTKDLADMEKMTTHAKIIDAYFSVQSTFFSVENKHAEGFKGALKTLKGWIALGTLPKQIKETQEKVEVCFKYFYGALILDAVAAIGTLVNKSYDAANFLEKQLGLSYFAGVTDRFASTHFGFLGLASSARLLTAGEKVVSYFIDSHVFSCSRPDFDGCVKNGLKVVENLSTVVFASAMIYGGSNQLKTATSAISAFAKGAEYYWSNVLL